MSDTSVFNMQPELIEVTKHKIELESEKIQAEIDKIKTEREQGLVDLANNKISLELTKIMRTKELEKEEIRRADDYYQRIYRFGGAVNGENVQVCMNTLSIWNRIDPYCDMTIVLHSPGGDIINGMALYDYIQTLKVTHQITTKAIGMAASMAGILLQAGHTRVMTKQSWLLIHEAQFAAMGSFGAVVDTVEWVKKIQDRILDILSERSKISKAEIKESWDRKDWWLSSDDALKYGFVDIIE